MNLKFNNGCRFFDNKLIQNLVHVQKYAIINVCFISWFKLIFKQNFPNSSNSSLGTGKIIKSFNIVVRTW